MIPFPNLIAGVLIGIASDTWLQRLIIPFGWGLVVCVYTSLFRKDERDIYIADRKSIDHKAKWGLSDLQSFYFVEYMTASFISLTFSLVSGAIKGLF
jgi:hypothetical protein